MVIKTATIGGNEVEVRVDYPVYYIIRHKETDAEPVAFIVIRDESEDVAFPDSVGVFLRKNFDIVRTTEAEAETYEAIGVAPIFDRGKLARWVEGINKAIQKAVADGGFNEENNKLDCDGHVYDLNLVWNEHKKPW